MFCELGSWLQYCPVKSVPVPSAPGVTWLTLVDPPFKSALGIGIEDVSVASPKASPTNAPEESIRLVILRVIICVGLAIHGRDKQFEGWCISEGVNSIKQVA